MATNPYDLAAVRNAATKKPSVVSAMKRRNRELEAELADALEKSDRRIEEAQRNEKRAIDMVVDLRRELVEARAELQVRDNCANEVLRILREATGKRDFHSEIEAAEHAAKMLADARLDAERYHHIRTGSLIHWESGKIHNRISWPTIFAAEPVDGGNYRDRFDAAIDAAIKEAK